MLPQPKPVPAKHGKGLVCTRVKVDGTIPYGDDQTKMAWNSAYTHQTANYLCDGAVDKEGSDLLFAS